LSKLIDIRVKIIHQTHLAYLLTHNNEKHVWIPKSKCQFYGDYEDKEEFGIGTLTLTEEEAIEKELV